MGAGRGLRWGMPGVAVVLAVAACGGPVGPAGGSPGGGGLELRVDPVVERPAPDSAHARELVAGLNDVGLEVFAAAAQGSDEDLVLSPLSVGVAFGMADAGASGDTADALEQLFAYPVAGEERWGAFNALEQAVSSEDGPVVRLANRQFPDESFETVEGYDELLGRWFGAGVEPLPLQEESEASREAINGWIAERTAHLIPELLPAGSIGPATEMVLVNTVYLKADWAAPFDEQSTEDAPFTRLDGTSVTVPLMHHPNLGGPAVVTTDYRATEVRYDGAELSMLVVVPEHGRYDEVAARLTRGLVEEIDAAARPGAVELYLPRFESTSAIDLRAVLEGALGVEDLFGVPGFEGVSPGLALEQALHGAKIIVDEEGTEAAAATALTMMSSGPAPPEVTVRADTPFLYLIRHKPTGAVLFVGRVLDPIA